MVSRRRSLQLAGTALAAALAGCSTDVLDGSPRTEYALYVDRFATDPVPWALYEPDDDELFGGPARTALDEILPEGRYTTHGYVAVPEGSYVERDGRYYRTEAFVTGRVRVARPVVRAEQVEEDAVPEDAEDIDSLGRPSARVLKILHSHAVSDGTSGAGDLLRGDAYVLTRPAERESRLAAGDLDGQVVTMTADGAFSLRVAVDREEVTLTDHTVTAVEVADSRDAFADVVLGSRVDVDVGTVNLPEAAGDLLDDAIGQESYRETGELSESFETLLRRLGFDPDEPANGRILWYGGSLFRARYYVGETG